MTTPKSGTVQQQELLLEYFTVSERVIVELSKKAPDVSVISALKRKLESLRDRIQDPPANIAEVQIEKWRESRAGA
jgi:hypothetical protein